VLGQSSAGLLSNTFDFGREEARLAVSLTHKYCPKCHHDFYKALPAIDDFNDVDDDDVWLDEFFVES
jgi:hypothetical protein